MDIESIFTSYLQRVSKNKRQLIFLASILTFCLSIISIVFGVNSNILDEYMRAEESYEFRTFRDIISFPIKQHKLFTQNPEKLEILSGKDKSINHLKIIDATVNSSVYKDYQFQTFKSFINNENGIIRTKIEKEHLPILIDFVLRKIKKNLTEQPVYLENLYIMRGWNESDNQPLYIPDKEEIFLGNDITNEVLKRYAEDLNSFRAKKGDESRFDLIFKELENQKDSTIVTVISDFNEEKPFISDGLKSSLGSLRKNKPNLKFNLIELDNNPDQPYDNSGSVIAMIKSYFRTTHLDLSQVTLDINEARLKSLLAYNQPKSESLILTPIPRESVLQEGFGYNLPSSQLKLSLGEGKYTFRFEAAVSKTGLELRYENEIYQLTPGVEIEIDIKSKWSSDLILSYRNESFEKTIGFLKVFSVNKSTNAEFLLIQKRALNLPTIGFSMLCYTSIFLLLGCLFYILINEVSFPTWWRKLRLNFLSSIVFPITLILYFYSFQGIKHYGKYLIFPFWEFYLAFLLILVVFFIIRKYELTLIKKESLSITDNSQLK